NILFEASRFQCTLSQTCARSGRCVLSVQSWRVEFATSFSALNRPNTTYNCRKQS
ncbi:hypothetical protein K470DRAFT_256234, partial [Piedraia hortae CBS 480.64]